MKTLMKITIKIYINQKYRALNRKYFKKSFFVNSLTINTKNGNFLISAISKNGRTKSQSFRMNSFSKINNQIFNKFFHTPITVQSENCNQIIKMYYKELDDYVFIKEILNIIESKLKPSKVIQNYEKGLINEFYSYFVNLSLNLQFLDQELF